MIHKEENKNFNFDNKMSEESFKFEIQSWFNPIPSVSSFALTKLFFYHFEGDLGFKEAKIEP